MKIKHLQHGLAYLVDEKIMYYCKQTKRFYKEKDLDGPSISAALAESIENILLIKAKQQPYEI